MHIFTKRQIVVMREWNYSLMQENKRIIQISTIYFISTLYGYIIHYNYFWVDIHFDMT